MNRRHFLQTLATLAGATLSSNALSIVSITEPDKYQKTVQLLSNYFLQTDDEGFNKAADILFNHLLTEFGEPLENERVFNEVNKYLGPGSPRCMPNMPNIISGAEPIDADIKDSVFPVLTMIALFRTRPFMIRSIPSAITVSLKYKNIIANQVFGSKRG